MEVDVLRVPISENANIHIYPIGAAKCYEIPQSEALDYHESRFQIVEGHDYEFTLQPESLRIDAIPLVLTPFRSRPHCGLIRAVNLPGALQLTARWRRNGIEQEGPVNIEVRSSKLDYRTHYRLMMESIAEKSIDLLLRSNSSVRQALSIKSDEEAKTLYQRFSFLRSVILTAEFQQAVQHILSGPRVGWTQDIQQRPLLRHGPVRGTILRQLASGSNRMPLPQEHALQKRGLHSLPLRITARHSKETIDIPENRFVKHALSYFCREIANVRAIFESKNRHPRHQSRELQEARACEAWLEETLQNPFFTEISDATSLSLNSPTLQRKHGYREVYRTWSLFGLAARLSWAGGDDVYAAGKRDVATLYEYWTFFQMLDIFSEVFNVKQADYSRLFRETEDGLGLRLASGKSFRIRGQKGSLQARFCYNHTFQASEAPHAGSYSLPMRPDFTISLWPLNVHMRDAERREAIVHLHFDAKYRLEHALEFHTSMQKLNEVKADERRGVYRRADILKMHAYKDAVRRTASAYVLYPGDKEEMRGLKAAILPAIGAFRLHPADLTGHGDVRQFLEGVAEALSKNTGKDQAMTHHTHAIYSDQLHVTRDSSWLRKP